MFGFFCVLKNDFSFCISLLFFLLHLLNTVSLFLHSFFSKYKKTLFLLENGAKTVSCFLFLFSWFQKHVVSEKIRVIFPLFLICFLNSSLSSLKTTKNSSKKSSCFVSVPSFFLFHLFSFNIFPYFLSSLFSLFTFSFHPFVHPFLLFSPFSFLYFSIWCFLVLFFLHRRFCVSSLCLTSLFFSLFCSWSHFSFHTSSLPCSSSSPYLFLTQKFQNFLWSIFLDEILSLFFELSLLRCFIFCFFTFASSSFLVCSMFYS